MFIKSCLKKATPFVLGMSLMIQTYATVDGSELTIGPASRQVPFESLELNNQPIPKYSNGYMLAWRRTIPASDLATNLTLFDRDGRVVRKLRLWIDDATSVTIVDGTVDPGGAIAVVGLAVSRTGQFAGFMGLIDGVGVTKIVQIAPFEGDGVTFASDGSIWVLGHQWSPDRHRKTAPAHSVLRRFSGSGTVVAEYLKWPEFACGPHPIESANGSTAKILRGPAYVGLLLPACNRWMEISLNGEIKRSVTCTPPESTRHPGARQVGTPVISNSGEVLANNADGVLRLDMKTGVWHPVTGVAVPVSWFAGVDGDSLVYRSGLGGGFMWAKVQ